MNSSNRYAAVLDHSGITESTQSPAQKEFANGVLRFGSQDLDHSEFSRSKNETTGTKPNGINRTLRPALIPFLHDFLPCRSMELLSGKALANGVNVVNSSKLHLSIRHSEPPQTGKELNGVCETAEGRAVKRLYPPMTNPPPPKPGWKRLDSGSTSLAKMLAGKLEENPKRRVSVQWTLEEESE